MPTQDRDQFRLGEPVVPAEPLRALLCADVLDGFLDQPYSRVQRTGLPACRAQNRSPARARVLDPLHAGHATAAASHSAITTQPEEARKALAAIETTSRETLSGLRRTLVALRQSDSEAYAEQASLAPAPGLAWPGLAELEGLATATAEAGVRVDLSWTGDRRPLPGDIDLSAFRIVQEAVTNVVRHAGVRHCRVAVEYGADTLSLEIVDDGNGGAGRRPGRGFGITGMRERAGLLHGEFSAGPRPEGGFRVSARLPLPERSVEPDPAAAAPAGAPAGEPVR